MDDFDQYLFLLSSDWCFSRLCIRLGLTDEQMKSVQLAAREAVKNIMSTCASTQPEYLHVVMSNSRKEETWSVFVRHVGNDKLIQRIELFMNKSPSHTHEEGVVLNVFLILLEDSIDSARNMLDLTFLQDKKNVVENIIRSWSNNEIQDSDKIALTSNSTWDRYLLSLFPEVPTALSDFYDVKIANISTFDSLWASLNEALPQEEKKKLIESLALVYKEITENDCPNIPWL